MVFTGHLEGISRDWKTDKVTATFSFEDKGAAFALDKLKDYRLYIEVKKWRKKRSLDANGMLWSCLGEIAAALRTDQWEVYLQMLKRYGKYTYVCVKPNVVDAMKLQWRECEVVGEIEINGQKAVQMLCYFGSSTYNTQEFSVLLEGVIDEMKEMGLTPPPSREMRRVLEEMEKKNGISITE